MQTQAYFEDIQQHIIKELREAKESIFVAVAWFTDPELFELLCDKASKNVRVFLLLLNDEINQSMDFGLNFGRLRDVGGKVHLIGSETEMMHNKFCVIDRKVVITGSYNWTRKAKKNEENVTITKYNTILASRFIKQFQRLNKKYLGEETELQSYLDSIYNAQIGSINVAKTDFGKTISASDIGLNIILNLEDSELIPYRKGDKWGFSDREKKIVIACVHEDVLPFKNRVAIIKSLPHSYSSFGLINQNGKKIVPAIYSHMEHVSYNLVKVGLHYPNVNKTRTGYFDTLGNEIISPSRLVADDYSEGLFPMFKSCTEFGCEFAYFNTTGNEVFSFERARYDKIHSFKNGFAIVRRRNLCGLIDKTGNEVFPCTYVHMDFFSEGIAKVFKGGLWGFVNITGRLIVQFKYDKVGDFKDGRAWVEKKYKFGFINSQGEEVVRPIYERVGNFNNGLAPVYMKNEGGGYINTEGKEVIKCRFYFVGAFNEGFALVQERARGKFGFINRLGSVVIPMIYDYGSQDFFKGIAKVKKDGLFGYLDKGGHEVIECKYVDVGGYTNGMISVTQKRSSENQVGYLNGEGKEVISPRFMSGEDFKNGLAKVRLSQYKTCYIDLAGEQYYEP